VGEEGFVQGNFVLN